MNKSYFITGNDTNVGKTWVTITLMHYFKQQGLSVVGMKPVATGCDLIAGRRQNTDALLMQQYASIPLAYEQINPHAYELPVSPHLADSQNPVDLNNLLVQFNALQKLADIVVVEGAGGWYTPVNATQDMSDLAKLLAIPVILVVAIRLGCINQAKLTYQAIVQSGAVCQGWIGVCVEPEMLMQDENIASINTALKLPLLGILPYQFKADFNVLAKKIKNIEPF